MERINKIMTTIFNQIEVDKTEQECLHKSCSQCNGTGKKKSDGKICIHSISCSCKKCSSIYY